MSIFDSGLIEKEYVVGDFYSIKIYNAAYWSIDENLKRIFGDCVLNYVEPVSYIYDFFKNMELMKFNDLMESFETQKHSHWEKQRKLHKFLKRKMKVRSRYIKESHFSSNMTGYTIFIPNGECIEMATADGIMIAFMNKSFLVGK